MDKNDTKLLKSIEKNWMASLSFLDNTYIHVILVFIVFIFATRIFYNVNDFVEMTYRYSLVRIVVLLAIVYVLPKSPLLSVLLAICYAISLRKLSTQENFEDTVVTTPSNMMAVPTMQPIPGPPILIQEQEEMLARPKYMKSMPSSIPSVSRKVVMEEEESLMRQRESFIPNMMYNSSYDREDDSQSESDSESDSTEVEEPMDNFESDDCLNNTPSSFQSVGNLCSPVSTFRSDSDIQGLQSPNGYSLMNGYTLDME
jgi:hypothetical protein